MGSEITVDSCRCDKGLLRQKVKSFVLHGVIGGWVRERPNKNRHTVGIDYFHCNSGLNWQIAGDGNCAPELAANANQTFRREMTLGHALTAYKRL
jgi:hypothetical protein